MAGSLNRVQLIGNLGRDPEVRTFSNGNKVCNFSVACSESWKDRNTGERREKTEWVNVAIFSEGLIRVCEQYLRKGSKVYVEGKFQTRKWQDQSGQDRYSTEVVIQGFGGQLIMLSKQDGGISGGSSGGGYGNDSSGYGDSGTSGGYSGGGSGGGAGSDLDDEIPF